MAAPPILCPSWQCEKGAILIGIVLTDGSVAFATNQVVVSERFAAAARRRRFPERQFRFSSPCKYGKCIQWDGDRCGVLDKVMEEDVPGGGVQTLPACSIRGDCRWHLQSGDDACFACTRIAKDMHEELPVNQA